MEDDPTPTLDHTSYVVGLIFGNREDEKRGGERKEENMR
jgi:hypothetical protein